MSLCGVVLFAVSCSEDGSGTGPSAVPFDDSVDPAGLVWTVGTMGGLRGIDMNDTVLHVVDIGFSIYECVAATGRFVWIAGGMSAGVQRIEPFLDSAATVTKPAAITATAASQQAGTVEELETAAGRVWAIGSGGLALFGIDTASNTMDVTVALGGGTDSSRALSMCPAGSRMYVTSTNPLRLHEVDLLAATSVPIDVDTGDGSGRATVGYDGASVYVYIAARRELVVVRPSDRAVSSRVAVAGVSRGDESMTASTRGVWVSMRTGTHALLKVSPEDGSTVGQASFAQGVESLTWARVYGQRLMCVLINGPTNSVVELDPGDMTVRDRVDGVYVNAVAVGR